MSTVVTILIVSAILIGLPLLCWIDPAGHYEAEVRRRQAEAQAARKNWG